MAKKSTAKSKAPKKSKSGSKTELSELKNPFEEIEKFMDHFYPRSWLRPFHWDFPNWSNIFPQMEENVPRVDVIDKDDQIIVKAEIPGMSKEDLDVSIIENILTIKGKKETEKEEGEYHTREITSSSFTRTLTLPAEVDGQQAKASFKNGVLELTLPKMAESRKKRITINE